MSRIGRNPIIVPNNVSVTIDKDNKVIIKGPLGELEQKVDKVISVNIENNSIVLTRPNDLNEVKAKHGLYRSLLNSMVIGVTNGFVKSLIIKGVGYKLNKTGNKLTLNLGFSHPIVVAEEPGIKIEVPSATEIKVSGIDKQKVGKVAAYIRDLKPVEPYHGYGIRYSDEVIVTKQGKTSGKGKK